MDVTLGPRYKYEYRKAGKSFEARPSWEPRSLSRQEKNSEEHAGGKARSEEP